MYYRPKFAAYLTVALTLLSALHSADAHFNPREHPRKVATCKARKRTPEPATIIELSLEYVDINPNAQKTIMMVHGWPSLWSTWSNQIQEFKEDYRLVVPDLRGFGESTHPGDTRTSGNMGDMVGDLVCILEHAGVSSAICMGHDWGSQVCYEAARMRPDIFAAVIGAVVPYIPSAGPFEDHTRDASNCQQPAPGLVFAKPRLVPDAWGHVEEIPPVPFFTAEEEDYFVEQYSIQGFRYTLQFYMTENRYASWQLAQSQGNHTIPQPALAIYPLNDPVADWMVAARLLKTAEFVPNLSTELLEGAHWVHLENPVKFNAIVRAWLRKLDESKNAENQHDVTDEL
ncbi:putative alpha beta-hydrolase [Lyophyllum shimeji]|uniref:Alpha beta-hydrolase n=1 Tax=Lyophyllum shimeji TaxID=47721 RepID=A0A9P3UVH8_LYOSH|nr:putative alpha beta-hydrolase [Lyophyllum shimeji]